MKKMNLYGWRLSLVRTLLYMLSLCAAVAVLGGVLMLMKNPLPWVAPCTAITLFTLALVLGVLCRRDEGLWFSALPVLTLTVLLLTVGLIWHGGKISALTYLYMALFVGIFLLGRILPRKKRRRRSF